MNGKSPVDLSDDNSSSSLNSSISSLSVGSDLTTSSQDSVLDPPLAAIVEDSNEDDNQIEKPLSNFTDSSSVDDDDVNEIIQNATENLSLIKESNEVGNKIDVNNPLNDASGKYELGPHQPKNHRDIDKRSIYVSNIPFKISPWKLKQLFSEGTDNIKGCGEKSVNRVTILCDRFTGLPKGYAYIEFANEEAVDNAIKFNGIEVDGRIIGVVRKRTNVPYINEPLKNKSSIDSSNNTFFHPKRKDNFNKSNYNSNRNGYVNRHVRNNNNNIINNDNYNNNNNNHNINNHNNNFNDNSNSNNDNNNNNKNKYRDNITQDNKNNRSNGFSNFNTNNYSNNNTGFNKYKNSPNLIPHSNSNYVFINGQSRGNANNNNNNSNSNSNKNNQNHNNYRGNGNHYGRSSGRSRGVSNGSNFQIPSKPSKPSKLIIDNNHYLTPSSRVGVYNNNLNED